MKWENGKFEVDTDPNRIDLERVFGFLQTTYWAAERTFAEVRQTWERSNPVFGVYLRGGDKTQIACARLLSDGVSFAWLADVFVDPEYRGRGVGKFLIRCVTAHPDCATVRLALLGTKDAHGLYRQFGWEDLPAPGNFLVRFDPTKPRPVASVPVDCCGETERLGQASV